MDEQLKQRLLGATIIVALVVIFVPMLFEDPDHPAGKGASDVPALPEAIEERTIELPKSAADVERSEKKEEKAEAESGYRVIPLEDAPPKPAKVEPAKAEPAHVTEAAASPEEPVEEAVAPVEEDFSGEGEEPLEQPEAKAVPKASPAELSRQGKSGILSPAPAAPPKKPKNGLGAGHTEPTAKPSGTERALAPESQAPKPKTPPPPVKPAEPVARKPEKPKSNPSKPAVPAAEASRHAPSPEAADGGEPAPAKPKPSTSVPKPTQPEAAAKPLAGKPPEPKHAAAESESETPTAWMIQAGSFAGETNARALADRLRKQNIAAYVEAVPGNSGSVYRVRVGPELSRSRAEQIQKQIENAVGIKGLILPRK